MRLFFQASNFSVHIHVLFFRFIPQKLIAFIFASMHDDSCLILLSHTSLRIFDVIPTVYLVARFSPLYALRNLEELGIHRPASCSFIC